MELGFRGRVALAFVVGLWSLAAQFIFNRIIFFYLAHSDIAAACIITVHLSGFLIGTLIAPRIKLSLSNLLCLALALSVLAALSVWRAGAPVFGLGITVTLAILFGVLLATLSGMLLIRLIEDARVDGAARPVIIADSGGSVLGAALAGFYLVPYAGLSASFLFVFIAQAFALIVAASEERRIKHAGLGLIIAAVGGGLFLLPSNTRMADLSVQDEWASRIIADSVISNENKDPERLIHSQNSPYGVVSVFEASSGIQMLLDSKLLCHLRDAPLSQHFQFQLGSIPAKMVAQNVNATPARTAVVGLGCGLTLAGMLSELSPSTSTEVIEINPEIPKAQKLFWKHLPHNPSDPRVQITIADGFTHFAARHGADPYQVVVLDLSWAHDMVATHLFSVEMFQNIQANLTHDGVLALWLLSSSPFTPESLIGYRTLKAVFPYVYADFVDGAVVYFASERGDIVNYLSPEGERISSWLLDLPEDGPINTLDTLVLGRKRLQLAADDFVGQR